MIDVWLIENNFNPKAKILKVRTLKDKNVKMISQRICVFHVHLSIISETLRSRFRLQLQFELHTFIAAKRCAKRQTHYTHRRCDTLMAALPVSLLRQPLIFTIIIIITATKNTKIITKEQSANNKKTVKCLYCNLIYSLNLLLFGGSSFSTRLYILFDYL